MRMRVWRAALVAALLLCLVAVPAAEAKSFTLRRLAVEAQLRGDGALHIVEHVTYDFDGSFSQATHPIPRGDYRIIEMSVSENGRPVPFSGAPYDLKWTYSAEDEQRTFDIAYTVLGATTFGSDVGELYWKWVGPEHPGIDVLSVRLNVPGDGVGIRAWAHGPRNGIVLPGKITTFDVVGVPSGRFVEGRVAVPVTAFTVAPGSEPRLARIIAEEERFIARDLAREQRRKDRRWLGLAFAPGWIIWFLLWRRWGRDPKPATPVGEYQREPFDDPPSVVDGLLRYGSVRPDAFSATVMDLAQRGHLTIEEFKIDRLFRDKTDWRFRRQATDGELEPFERRILDRLFHDGDETTQSEFTKWGKQHPTQAQKFWQGFQKSVQSELRRRKYLMGGRGWPYFLNIVTVLAVEGCAIAALTSGTRFGVVLGLVCLVSGLLQLVATVPLRSRTKVGAQRAAEWQAFGRFLRDFSQMEDAPVGHLELWERYLVYSVALGVSEPLARALALKVPPEQQQTGAFMPWYSGGDGVASFGSLHHFGETFGSSVQSAFTPSSSSGSGGGFSGGGGGGGGGGGFGAS